MSREMFQPSFFLQMDSELQLKASLIFPKNCLIETDGMLLQSKFWQLTNADGTSFFFV